MSNISKFLKGGKKKGDAPAEPVAAPKPPMAQPLIDTADPARTATRQVDLSAVARADAESASEEEVTVEVPGKAPPIYPSAPPKPVSPEQAQGNVVPISAARQSPAAPAAAEAGEAEAETPAPPAAAKPAAEKSLDVPKLLEQITRSVKKLLVPIEERLGKLEEALAGNDETLNQIIENISGPNPDDPEANAVDDEGRPVIGLAGQVAAVSDALEELRTQLLGANPSDTLENFGGNAAVPMLLEQLMETATQVNEVVGKDGERIPSIVNSNTKLTAKTLVIEMLKAEPDLARLRQAAIEGGPDTSKDILEALAGSEEYALEVVSALYLAPAESLDDADKAQLKAEISATAKAVGQRAAYYHENLDWNAIEQEAAEWRAPVSEPEQTGGDS
ncbi:hypothetical protein L0Y65_04030 [Candidatus Micrarchaeota archaeon]|nr:hypothetical protein [Candidatus Micrarchaeota archaeon]